MHDCQPASPVHLPRRVTIRSDSDPPDPHQCTKLHGHDPQRSRELAKACGKYLLATRLASVKELREEVLSRPGRYRVLAENLQAKEVVVGDGVRQKRYILCYNPKEADRQRQHREQVIAELTQELARHPDRKATAQWAIELKASQRYGRYLRIDAGGKLKLDGASVREQARFDGKWVIETNDDTLSVEDAANGYKALLIIERCFRCLKRTQIKMTPMYHWLPRRIETHVKICVLALLIERVVERTCNQPWPRVRETLRRLQATRFQTPSGQFFQRNLPTEGASRTLKALEIPLPKRILAIEPRPTSLAEA